MKKEVKITEENIEGYKKLYEIKENVTDADIKKVLKNMLICLFLGLGFSFVLPLSYFLVSLLSTMGVTFYIVIKTIQKCMDKKEDELVKAFSNLDLDLFIESEVLLEKIREFERTKNGNSSIEKEATKEEPISGEFYSDVTQEREKILVKKFRYTVSVEKKFENKEKKMKK